MNCNSIRFRQIESDSTGPRSLARTARLLILMLLLVGVSGRTSRAQISGEAFSGTPFGVGRIVVRLPSGATAGLSGDDAFELVEKNDRVLYPTSGGALLGRLLGGTRDKASATIFFLFSGNLPLELTVKAPASQKIILRPRQQPRAQRRLLKGWWRQTNITARVAADRDDYPREIDDYLLSMLSVRLKLPPTLLGQKRFESSGEQGLGLLLGTESLRSELLRQTMLGRADRGPADRPLPKMPTTPPLGVAPPPRNIKIESIAMHVPEESLYIRFGNYNNYRWLRRTLDEYGGDLANLIIARGRDFGQNSRMEQQLSMRETALSGVLGPQVISDVALVGFDSFFREGAAIGILFEARSNLLLSREIAQQRRAALTRDPRAKETKVQFGKHQISMIRTPDNSIRSIYASHGDYHLVTTSLTLARRFLEASDGKGALGNSIGFRHGRTRVPIARGDTVFAFLSEAFFRNLAGPHYRVEMSRRLRSATDLELLQLARLAARAEKKPSDTIEQLISGGFLPPGFAQRPDGSRLVESKDGSAADSVRGGRSTFVPVADVVVKNVTATEVADYQQFAEQVRSTLGPMQPLIVGLRREKTKTKDVERIVIDAHISPFTGPRYEQLADKLGPATATAIAPMKEDLISVQAVLKADDRGHRHLFAGIEDFRHPVDVRKINLLEMLRIARQTEAYVGTWPKEGELARMFGLDGRFPEDEIGTIDFLPGLGLWVTKLNDFTVLTINKENLIQTARQLRTIEAASPAHLRITAGDLSQTHLGRLLSSLGYGQAHSASTGNSRFMHRIAAQLHVPRGKAKAIAERLSASRLICPLGGEYELRRHPSGLTSWVSTAWFDKQGKPLSGKADDYLAPPLKWFRGLSAEAILEHHSLRLHAELLMAGKGKGGFTFPGLPGF